MRPHRLRLEAFGAFPDRVDVDFDRVGSGGLLLLCGETGAGKTTLLDAIGFALFGKVPGMRGKVTGDPDLRSHHAAASARPEASLEFSVSAERFRITRSPAWDRSKRAGGTTRAHPTARLDRHTAEGWDTIASRPQDVGHEIGLMLGMTHDQFFQVILLPQGRFADFLQAGHDDRERLLKTLFGVGRFEFTEQWLRDRAKSGHDELGVATAELGRVAARIAQVAGAAEPADPTDDPAWATDLARQADAAAAVAEAVQRTADQARTAADAALAGARDLVRRIERRRTLTARRNELAERRAAVDQLAAEADAARRAAVVTPALTELRRRTVAAEQTRAAADAARQRLAAHPAGLLSTDPHSPGQLTAHHGDRPSGPPDVDELLGLVRLAHVEVGRLEGLARTRAEAEDDDRAARQAERDAEEHRRDAEALAHRLDDELPAVRAAAESRVAAARRAGATLPALTERARWTRELAGAVADQHRARRDADVARDRAAVARSQAEDLRRQRFDAITAELAAALVDDTPCPVCGAFEHPDPAEGRADHVSKEEETTAEQEADRIAAEAAVALRAADRWETQVRTLHAELAREPSAPVDPPAEEALAQVRRFDLAELLDDRAPASAGRLAELAAEVDDQVTAYTDAAVDLAPAEAAQLAVYEEDKDVAARLAASRSSEQAGRLRAAQLHQLAATRLAAVPADLHDAEALTARLDAVTALADDQQATHDAELAAERARAEHVQAGLTALDLVRQAEFSDLDDAAAAVRDTDWLRTAEREVQAHRDETAAVAAALSDDNLAVDPALAEHFIDHPADHLAEHEAAAGAARQAHEATVAALAQARGRAAELTALHTTFTADLAALDPLRAEADELHQLAELAAGRGGNTEGMPLSSFVLAARLEEVAIAASRRFAAMSGGRFTLVHDTGERRDRRRRAGLGLLVEDAWTGRRRNTGTLSGGETFQAALSLALGLADVVTAEAGGRRMDALFIDEGFGTLDPDSLDEVMGVLDELRSGGRLVGVVSHVADLRQRIPNQIRVSKGTNGSSVETTP
ncbi:AAA family ATPase [Candidatus Frankia alpina]|uniref:AAA family ATPase n=1 Tax=Candidatus Frankia alpina TaxID=2699483 RepID=UPI0013D39BE4|nr:AAA family ATPase [Candidatus Frankia alpina]